MSVLYLNLFVCNVNSGSLALLYLCSRVTAWVSLRRKLRLGPFFCYLF